MNYKKWVLAASLLLVFGIGVGLFNPVGAALPPEYTAGLKELTEIFASGSILTLLFIFVKNVTALLISFVLSPFFCIAPLATLLINGWLIGYVATGVVGQESIGYLLAGILPHGIFEIPALLMAQAAALNFGASTMMVLIRRRNRGQILTHLNQNIKYLGMALILLVPAAVIETYFTPWLLKMASG
jgi:stage II sporulation protein M